MRLFPLVGLALAACPTEDLLGTGVNIFKDDLTRPFNLQGGQIFTFAPHCLKIFEPNHTVMSMSITSSASEFRDYILNSSSWPYYTSAVEDTMRQYDPVYETNGNGFTIARRIYSLRSLNSMCIPTFNLQDRVRKWMDNLEVNMTSLSDWQLWQSFVNIFHLSHVVMEVGLGVQMQIFVSCPRADQTFWVSCGYSSARGMSADEFGCPRSVWPDCNNAGGFFAQEVTVNGGDPILGMELIIGQSYPNSTSENVLRNFLESGEDIKHEGTVTPLTLVIVPFSDILRGLQMMEQADVMDEVIGENGYIQCLSLHAGGIYHWERMDTRTAEGRWLWHCVPDTKEDSWKMPWVSVVVISGVSSALLVSVVYCWCQRVQRRRAGKANVAQIRTGNYYKDLAALTSED